MFKTIMDRKFIKRLLYTTSSERTLRTPTKSGSPTQRPAISKPISIACRREGDTQNRSFTGQSIVISLGVHFNTYLLICYTIILYRYMVCPYIFNVSLVQHY